MRRIYLNHQKKIEDLSGKYNSNIQRAMSIVRMKKVKYTISKKWYHFDCAGREKSLTNYEKSGKVKKWKCSKYALDCKVKEVKS
jgi:hypothetical protein